MSKVSTLDTNTMSCACPACEEIINVTEKEFINELEEGIDEYFVICPHCGESFFTSTIY